MTTTWATLKIGGGGFVTHLDLMADGTKVVGVDTYGRISVCRRRLAADRHHAVDARSLLRHRAGRRHL